MMSDKKISQLPGSTTPLAGSEELAVVQSGDTKKVSVANLTSGRAVAVSTLQTAGKIGVAVDPATSLGLLSNTDVAWAGGNASDALVWRSTQNDWALAFLATPAAGAGYGLRLHTAGETTSDYPLAVSSGAAGGSFKFTVFGDGTTTITGGNLVIGTSGKGIDFSADPSAAGMTSELLDDYEEGTWTPVISSTSGAITSYTVYAANYTKIGRLVNIILQFAVSDNGTGSGALFVEGLPFTCGAQTCGVTFNQSSGYAGTLTVNTSATNGYIYSYDGTYPIATGQTLQANFTYIV